MATQDSVMGLFTDPQQYQQAMLQQQMKQNYDIAQLTPEQQVTGGLRTAGYQLGGGIGGLMGVEDPQMKLQTLRNQLAQGKDLTSSTGWAEYAKALQEKGDLPGAAMAAQKSTEITSGAENKQAKLEQALQIARMNNEARIEAARERGATALQIAQLQAESRNQMAQLAAALKGEKQQTADDKAAVRIGQNTTFDALISEGTGLTSEIDKNKDAFSLSGRGTAAFQSIFNPEAPEVKVKSNVDAYLNKARNAYLLAAKGTQTEGDAQRAWAEFAGSLDFSSAAGAKRSVERITKELSTQKAANEAYLKSRGISSGAPLGTKENPIKLK